MQIQQTTNAKIIANLIQGTHDTFHEKYPHYFKKFSFEAAQQFFEQKAADPHNEFYVLYDLYDGNEMAGFIWAYVEEKDETPLTEKMSTLFIKKVVVHPNHRNRGYGQDLIKYVEQLARDKGCQYIEAELWYVDNDVVEFLRKSDYALHKGIVWKHL